MGVNTHDLIVPGGLYYYYPKNRSETFLDLGVLVKNLKPGHPVTTTWKRVYVIEKDGTAAFPSFADVKTVEPGSKFDPFKIGIATEAYDGIPVAFDNDTYLRLIFVVAKKQTIVFGIEDSPTVTFTLQ